MALPDLDVLVAVVEGGSLTAAAERLGVPRPTLSRRLSRLEAELGTRLVQRSTRSLSLTEAGQELYRHARPIVDAIETATTSVRARDAVPRGLLRLSMPPGGDALFGQMLAAFLAEHPQVRLEVHSTTRHVDLVAEGFDLAIRAGQTLHPSLVARKLADTHLLPVASPAYLARRGRPAEPADLAEHDCLVGFERGETPQRRWPLRDGGAVPVRGRLACNDLQVLVQACRADMGIALLPDTFVADDLATGRLERVLADEVGIRGQLALVFPERRLMLPRVRAFIDHVVAWSGDSPWVRLAGSGRGPHLPVAGAPDGTLVERGG